MQRTYEETAAENIPGSGGGGHMKKIVIVDYDQSFHPYVRILLERLGYTVMPAKRGIDIIKLAQFEQPDALILDVGEDTKDGMMIFKHIQMNEQTSAISVIIVCNNLAPDIIEDCNRLGCAGYLTKPIKIEELYDTLEHVFSPRTIRRKHLRVAVNKKIDVLYRGNEYTLYTGNLSEGGIYIRKTNPFPSGSEMEITIPLANEGAITVKGVVVHVKGLLIDTFTSTQGMGIQFKDITDNQMMTLKRYKERLFAEDIFRGSFPKNC